MQRGWRLCSWGIKVAVIVGCLFQWGHEWLSVAALFAFRSMAQSRVGGLWPLLRLLDENVGAAVLTVCLGNLRNSFFTRKSAEDLWSVLLMFVQGLFDNRGGQTAHTTFSSLSCFFQFSREATALSGEGIERRQGWWDVAIEMLYSG
jgi:hypothetical protein